MFKKRYSVIDQIILIMTVSVIITKNWKIVSWQFLVTCLCFGILGGLIDALAESCGWDKSKEVQE